MDIKVSKNYCDSCTTLLGTDTYCRTVTFNSNEYENIPAKAIRQATYKVLEINEDRTTMEAQNSGCGCNCSGCC